MLNRLVSRGGDQARRPGLTARRGIAVAATCAMVGGLAVATTTVANAAVPEFPNNIVVFPDRDFVTLEGFQDHVGESALVEVTRPGVGVVGSAVGTIEEGDVAFEVNHPGGYCWGAGTNLKVTPDILGGDVVSLKIGGVSQGETTVSHAVVTDVQYSSGSSTLVVNGTLGPEFTGNRLNQLEQRIVNPDLRDTAVNRRDVRAVPGGLVAAAKGGYSSQLETTGASTFKATYEFDNASLAQIAATGGGERIMSWELEDADANRQGLTISEFGEAGGPGMGGCPNGPLQTGPVAPTDVTASKVSGGYKVSWTPAVAVAGTPAITGYEVTALDKTVVGSEQAFQGKRISGQAAKSTTLNLSGDEWIFEIVSVSSTGKTFPAVEFAPIDDTTAPTISASVPAGSYAVGQSVKLTSNEANTDIYYTLGDDKEPLSGGDSVSVDAVHYTGAIAVDASTVLRYAAFDPAGNLTTGELVYTISNTPPPAAPTNASASLSAGAATITWSSSDASVTSFTVSATSPTAGASIPAPVTVQAGQPLSASLTGLTAGASYEVSIEAVNPNGSTTTKLASFTAIGSVVANAGTDVTAKRGTTVSLDGSASIGGTSYKWDQLATSGGAVIAANSPDRVTLTSTTSTTSAKTSFAYPLYVGPRTGSAGMTNGPLYFRLTVSDGTTTKTDEVAVSPVNDRVTVSSAKYKTTDFRIIGTATTVGSTVTVRTLPDASGTVRIIGTATVVAAVAPATGGTWEVRVRTNVGANPGQVVAESNQGGSSTAFAVTLG